MVRVGGGALLEPALPAKGRATVHLHTLFSTIRLTPLGVYLHDSYNQPIFPSAKTLSP
jgi:hypothetical protein